MHGGIDQKFKDIVRNPTSEAEVDGLVCTLCSHIFNYDKNYDLNPQCYDSNVHNTRSGKIDFKVSNRGNPILIIENKHGQGASWLDAIEQAHRYCVNNDVSENMFVIVIRGTYMSAFLHQMDFHSDYGFSLKCPKYQDLIGIEVNNWGLFFINQSNTFHPQLKVYDMRPYPFGSDKLAVASILNYISGFSDMTFKEVGQDFSLPSHDRYGYSRPIGLSWAQNFMAKNLYISRNGRFRHR